MFITGKGKKCLYQPDFLLLLNLCHCFCHCHLVFCLYFKTFHTIGIKAQHLEKATLLKALPRHHLALVASPHGPVSSGPCQLYALYPFNSKPGVVTQEAEAGESHKFQVSLKDDVKPCLRK